MKAAFIAASLCLMATLSLQAASEVEETPVPPKPAAAETRLPGVGLAEFVTQTTGVAVSPLLGVGGIGAWTWFKTPEELRGSLPWYCHPGAWGTAFAVLALCFLKDFLGAAAPPLVKKPFDFAELFENKASALVASTAFLPVLMVATAEVEAAQLRESAQVTATAAADMGLATVPGLAVVEFSWVALALSIPLGLGIFVVVWLSCHALNVLIALSPFGIVDAGLKLAKLALISAIAGASLIHPFLGLALCLPLIIVAAFLSGWAFRLTVFGTVFGWDFLSGRKASLKTAAQGVKSFNVRKLQGVPARTWGELHINEAGMQVFRHRPWLVMPAQEVTVEAPFNCITRGLLHPTLTLRDDGGKSQSAFVLPPRYRASVEEISRRFGIQDIADSTLLRGLKAVRNWLVEMLSVGRNFVERKTAVQEQKALL